MSQLNLMFTDLALAEPERWEQFDEAQKQMVVETLARLMIRAAGATSPEEAAND
jgi:hypothetical protein